MAKIKIDKHDHLRVILTETLPYEVPITFLNEGLYFYLKEMNRKKEGVFLYSEYFHKFVRSFFYEDGYTKPYDYRISKNSSSKRLLSVPHPSIQRKVSELYSEYDSVMTALCDKSPITLRAPSRVANRFYEKELISYDKESELGKVSKVETEAEAFEKTSAYASSYFTYRKYNFLYKFYDSYESNRIEKKFEHLIRFDISKCFHNIYVPSLSWAVKTKEFSKKYADSYSFEGRFQKLMKDANHLDSSGIIVGPEFSRIYAEIILQDLDLKIIGRLKDERGAKFNKDYTMRRYVDDYFLYTTNSSDAKDYLVLIKDELEKYKLFINESKTEFIKVPFITGLTIAKMDCKELVKESFDRFFKEGYQDIDDESFLQISSPSREANLFLKKLKRVVKENDVNYESLSGYTLAELKRRVFRLIEDERLVKGIKSGESMVVQKLLLFAIEVSFFIYSMDIRVRTTYIITQLIVRLNDLTSLGNVELRDEVRKKIYDESTLLLSKMAVKGKANSIETLNLLIGIGVNVDDYPIDDDELLNLFNLKSVNEEIEFMNDFNTIGYFQIMVLSGFVRNRNESITTFLEGYILKIVDEEDLQKDTEITCIIFDSFSNPYFSDAFKSNLLNLVVDRIGLVIEKEIVLKELCSREWFFTWRYDNLAQVLMKKELRSPY